MSRTPDKNDLTVLKVTKLQRTQKVVTQNRVLLTDRKQKQNIKSPLMLIMLLKKKAKSRLDHAFMKISIFKNKTNANKNALRYLISIINFKNKRIQANCMQRIKKYVQKSKNTQYFIINLATILKSKIKKTKMATLFALKNIASTKSEQNNNQMSSRSQIKQSKPNLSRKKQLNKSVDSNLKNSTPKSNLYKKIDFQQPNDLIQEFSKLKKQNQQLRIMQLSQDVREVLKKIQRFDRVIYAQQAQKTSKQALACELKRLQKIKNSQKQMRTQYYDNQLTVTALYNHIKLISQLSNDITSLSSIKQKIDAEQSKRKQQQFKANLQSKRARTKSVSNQVQVKTLCDSIQDNLGKMQYDKCRVQMNQLISKYSTESSLSSRIVLYKALLELLNNQKQKDKFTEDIYKITMGLKSIDFNKQQKIKSIKNIQKELAVLINKLPKQEETTDDKILNIYQSVEILIRNLLIHFQKPVSQTQPSNLSKSKTVPEDPAKKLALLQKQLQESKKYVQQLQQASAQFKNFTKLKGEFQKKINTILQKAQSKLDYKKQYDALKRDKQFSVVKPFAQILRIQSIISIRFEEQLSTQISTIGNFMNSLVQINGKQKIKQQAKNKQIQVALQNFQRKNNKFKSLTQSIRNFLTIQSKQGQQNLIDVQKQKQNKKKITTENEPNFQQIIRQAQSQKQERIKLEKELSMLKQSSQLNNNFNNKLENVFKKYTKFQQWIQEYENLKKDKSSRSNRFYEDFIKFMDSIINVLRKQKDSDAKIQKYTNQVFKLLQKKPFDVEKSSSQLNKLLQIHCKSDNHLSSLLTILNTWTTQIISFYSSFQQQTAKKHTQKQIKMNEQIQSERKRTRDLNDKIKQLSEQNKKLQKKTKVSQSKQLSGQKRSGRSQELKKETSQNANKQQQVRILKQKIQVLQKQISQLKLEKTKKQESQKKPLKADDNKKLQQQIKKYEQLLRIQKINSSNQKSERVKQELYRNQIQKAIKTISAVVESANYKNIQTQMNKLAKIGEKDQKLKEFNSFLSSLLKMLVDKQNQLNSKKVSQNAQAQLKNKQKSELIIKFIKQIEQDIKNSLYLQNNNYWDKYANNQYKNVSVQIKQFIRFIKYLTGEIKNKHQKLQDATNKLKIDQTNSNTVLQFIKNIYDEMNKKDFFNNDEFWTSFESLTQPQNKTIKQIQKIIKKFAQILKTRLTQQRKLNEKSMKSYQIQLQKMNNLISQYEIKLKQKQTQYNQLHKSFIQLQRHSGDEQKKQTSLRNSRKSVRSNSSEKQSQTKNIKQTIKNFVNDEKNMLQKLQMAQNQKVALVQRINYLERQLDISYKTTQQLKASNKQLQKNISDQHANYQRQYQSWRQKILQNNKQTSNLRISYQKQFQQRQLKIIEQSQILAKQREVALEKYSKQFSKIQNQLNNQITILRQQLNIKSKELSKTTQFRSQDVSKFEAQNGRLRNQLSNASARLNNLNQVNSQLQNATRQNSQLQLKINQMSVKYNQLQKQLSNMKLIQDKFVVQQKNWKQKINSLQIQITQANSKKIINQNSNIQNNKIIELEQKIAKISQQYQMNIKHEVDQALRNQQEDFNKFLIVHDQQIQNHFFNIVIPQKLKQAQSKIQVKTLEPIKYGNIGQIQKIKNEHNQIIKQLEQSVSHQKTVIDELQKKLSQQSKKLQITTSDYETKLQKSIAIQQKLRRFIHGLQIPWEQAITGLVSQKISTLYLKKQVRTQIKEVIKEVIKTDPRLQIQIKQLKLNLQKQSKAFGQLQIRLNNEQAQKNKLVENLKSNNSSNLISMQQDLRRLQQNYQQVKTKYNMQIQSNRVIKNELSSLKNIQLKLKEDNYRFEQIIQDKERIIHQMNIVFRKDIESIQKQIHEKYQKQIKVCEINLNKYKLQIQALRSNQRLKAQSFNHVDCQRKYDDLQRKSTIQILDMKAKLQRRSQVQQQQVNLLKQVVQNQRIQLKQLQVVIKNSKESKDQSQKSKEEFLSQLRTVNLQKDRQVSKLKSQYQHKLSILQNQKSIIESKLSVNSNNNQNIKVIQLQSLINNKDFQIKQLRQSIQRKKKEVEQEQQKTFYIERERQNLRMACNNMETHIMRLQSDISYLTNQLQRYKETLYEIQNRQANLRNDIIRIKTESELDNNANYLRQEITHLKQEIIRITTTNVQQIHTVHTTKIQSFDSERIRKMIHDIQVNRNSERYGNENGQIQILKKINQQVSQLVATNRQLQSRCIMLQSQMQNQGRFAQNIHFFILLQDHMESLITFLIDKKIIPSNEAYSKFVFHCQETLSHQDFESYFMNWLNFLKSLFILSNDNKSQQLRQKAQEMIQLKQQMNQILDKHIEFVEDESYQTLNKYKMIFSDIKILLKEYINTGNQQYIQMIWRSLEPQNHLNQFNLPSNSQQ